MFDIHAKELIVGEIFVRVYNEQPTFQLEVCGILSRCKYMLYKSPLASVCLSVTYFELLHRKINNLQGENKDADQLRSNCEADQHLCFR